MNRARLQADGVDVELSRLLTITASPPSEGVSTARISSEAAAEFPRRGAPWMYLRYDQEMVWCMNREGMWSQKTRTCWNLHLSHLLKHLKKIRKPLNPSLKKPSNFLYCFISTWLNLRLFDYILYQGFEFIWSTQSHQCCICKITCTPLCSKLQVLLAFLDTY
jgi:hypothetical protein